jgi:hypothetical protein
MDRPSLQGVKDSREWLTGGTSPRIQASARGTVCHHLGARPRECIISLRANGATICSSIHMTKGTRSESTNWWTQQRPNRLPCEDKARLSWAHSHVLTIKEEPFGADPRNCLQGYGLHHAPRATDGFIEWRSNRCDSGPRNVCSGVRIERESQMLARPFANRWHHLDLGVQRQ